MSAPAAAQLQHPVDGNGNMYRSDSPKPMTSLEVTATISGTLSATDSSTGWTNTITYSGTLSLTLTRAAFIPRDYYPDFTSPAEGEFFLAADCCCWKCRFQVIPQEGGLTPPGTMDWESVWTGDDPPADSSGTFTPSISCDPGYVAAGQPPTGESYDSERELLRGALCRATGESGRVGQMVTLALAGITPRPDLFTTPPCSWSYTDTAGSDSGTGSTDLSLPGPADHDDYAGVESDSCGDAQSVSASIVFNGTDTVGTVTSTVSAITFEMTYSLT